MFISYCRLRRPTAKLGNGYHSLGDFKKAIEYHACHLRIAKQVGGTRLERVWFIEILAIPIIVLAILRRLSSIISVI